MLRPEDYAGRSLQGRVEDALQVLGDVWPALPAKLRTQVRGGLLSRLPPTGSQALLTAEGRRALTRPHWRAKDVSEGRALRGHPAQAVAAKAALVISDALSGRLDLVGPRVQARVATALDLALEGTVTGGGEMPSPIDEPHDRVSFVYPWRPTPVGTRNGLGIAHGSARLTWLDPADAPIACSLWTPEGRLDVRRHGDAWLRPLLEPDSWTPIALDRFRRAVATGEAWRDSPFLPRTGDDRPTFNIWDYASPRDGAKGDERRIAEACETCLARAGELHVIGGVVHRRTGEPVAGLRLVFFEGLPVVTPEWVTGDLSSSISMDTLACYDGESAVWGGVRRSPPTGGRLAPFGEYVSVRDWTRLSGALPHDASAVGGWRERNWPTMRDLVRLPDVPERGPDGDRVLQVARAWSTMLVHSFGSPTGEHSRTLDHFAPLARLLADEYAAPEQILACARPMCDGMPERWDGPNPELTFMWSYVAALSKHGAEEWLSSPRSTTRRH